MDIDLSGILLGADDLKLNENFPVKLGYKLPLATTTTLDSLFSQGINPEKPEDSEDLSEVLFPGFGKIDLRSLPFEVKTKSGSKKAQQLVAKSRPEEIKKIVIVMAPHIGDLMIDVYGNYMCQSLFQSANASQRLYLLKSMRNSLLKIAKDVRGTHSLQTVIGMASLEEEETIYKQEFSGKVVQLSTHAYASHVIQRLLITLKDRKFMINELQGNCTFLAKDKLGLCVIKKCVDDKTIFQELCRDALILVQDPYGNYVVQKVLDVWSGSACRPLFNQFKNNLGQLCVQKFSSNVMERCMRVDFLRENLISEVLSEEKLLVLMNCTYGCYVLRTAAEFGSLELKKKLKIILENLKPLLHKKKLKQKWSEIYNILEPFLE